MTILIKPDGWTFSYGDYVEKVFGSHWRGRVVGFYSSSVTPQGYAIESSFEPGSTQIYPVAALKKRDAP